ncbi:MAG: tRNA epoxyqueuosine(34) reductase QueG [candidate division WOR-3 bacterium]
MDLKKRIKEKAIEIGFDLFGVTTLEPSIYKEEFLSSLERYSYSDLEYLKRNIEERVNPKLRFPWAKSVIVVGINYWQGPLPELREGEVRISRYALGKDYHEVMREKLTILSEFIIKEVGVRKVKGYSDTGPLPEKELAKRAGLGWIGKNTLLVTEEFGSWVFLGELLIDFELEPDREKENKCRDCKICVDVCPSNALYKPYSLDPGKCTAYWTVSRGDYLPEWFPSPLNEYIFGCDICQEVCPFSKNARQTKIREFLPSKKLINPSLEFLQSLSDKDFNNLFGETPISWVGKRILIRNLKAFAKGCSSNSSSNLPLSSFRS